jgi:hypothetical protein
MRGKIVSSWIIAKSIFSFKTLIFIHIESKKITKIQNRSQQKSHACVPLSCFGKMRTKVRRRNAKTLNFRLALSP